MSPVLEFVGQVARDLVNDLHLPTATNLTVEVSPNPRRDGRIGYSAVATYRFNGIAIDRSLNGRHPMARDERMWHGVFARHADSLGPSSAARAATLAVFGVDPVLPQRPRAVPLRIDGDESVWRRLRSLLDDQRAAQEDE